MRIAIIGGGASGLACAIQSARNGHEVCVFESLDRVGKKILQTGNGRCNFSNLNLDASYYNNKEFVDKVFSLIGLNEILKFFESLGLEYYADDEGRLYPQTNQASSVLDVLRFECHRLGVQTKTNCCVLDVKKIGKAFEINGEKFERVVLASGGACQNLGKDYGHTSTKPRSGLVGLKTEKDDVSGLMGLRAFAKVKFEGHEEYGEVQFKAEGIGGICVFNISSLISRKNAKNPIIFIDFAPFYENSELRTKIEQRAKRLSDESVQNVFVGMFAKMLAQSFLKKCKIDMNTLCKDISVDQMNSLVNIIKNCPFKVVGMYDNAQVQVGGISINEIKDNLESKLVDNLFFVGECLDVDGLCGGYNLSWAWASGIRVGMQ